MSFKISVIIPCYNCEKVIDKTIDSIINQSISSWELIIIDDGSTDKSAEVIKPYLEDPRVKYFRQPNKGVTVARNQGVKYSSYDYIAFLDSDDEVKKDWLKDFANMLKQPKKVIAFCGVSKAGVNSVPKKTGDLHKNVIAQFNAGSFAVSREYFLKAGLYDENISQSENWELLIRIVDLIDDISEQSSYTNSINLIYHKDYSKKNSSKRIFNRAISFDYMSKKYINKLSPDILVKFNIISGRNFYKVGDRQKAIKKLMEAIRIKPMYLKSYYWMLKCIF